MNWAAIQDWMCEPFMLKRTGLSVAEHQARTVASYLDLIARAPDMPWIPVLQGYRVTDYLDHVDAYARAGVGLESADVVGLGSVCRRQGTGEIGEIIRVLQPLRLHGFGVKTGELAQSAALLASADSMAWSFRARHASPLPGCIGHKTCANCYRFARQWYDRVQTDLQNCAARVGWTQDEMPLYRRCLITEPSSGAPTAAIA